MQQISQIILVGGDCAALLSNKSLIFIFPACEQSAHFILSSLFFSPFLELLAELSPSSLPALPAPRNSSLLSPSNVHQLSSMLCPSSHLSYLKTPSHCDCPSPYLSAFHLLTYQTPKYNQIIIP